MFEFVPLDVRVIFELFPLAVIDELVSPEAVNGPDVNFPVTVNPSLTVSAFFVPS